LKVKTRTIIIVAVVIIVIIAIGVIGYQQVQQREALRNIQVSVDGVQPVSVNLSSATLNITLRITNPNGGAATLDKTDFTVTINNNSLGSGQNLEQVTIPAGGSQTVTIPFTVSYTGAVKTAWSYLTQGGADWRVVGTAYFDTLFGTVGVPYDFTGTTK
jgi:LEA14-like dessication related protein